MVTLGKNTYVVDTRDELGILFMEHHFHLEEWLIQTWIFKQIEFVTEENNQQYLLSVLTLETLSEI